MSQPVRRSRRISSRLSAASEANVTSHDDPPQPAVAGGRGSQQPPTGPGLNPQPSDLPPSRRQSGFSVVLPAAPPSRASGSRTSSADANSAALAAAAAAIAAVPVRNRTNLRRSLRNSRASMGADDPASRRQSLASVAESPDSERQPVATPSRRIARDLGRMSLASNTILEEREDATPSPASRSHPRITPEDDDSTVLAHSHITPEDDDSTVLAHSPTTQLMMEAVTQDENESSDISPAVSKEDQGQQEEQQEEAQEKLQEEPQAHRQQSPPQVSQSQPPPSQETKPSSQFESPLEMMQRAKAIAAQAAHEGMDAVAAPQSRIVIRYLILTNFKSYAGRQVVGPFDASFSSVVGPNGSGKSNVIDSLLFVFGFRASKMRQGKLSGLIHKSGAFPDLDFCDVQVQFDEVIDRPDGGVDPVNSKPIIISRRAFKNNSSKYYIDGRSSDYTSVTTLLKAKGVDLDHKRFLILQGEVESIAQMKPKATGDHDDGLLEYLEDIIGTSKYKSAIEAASAEADTLAEACAEKAGRVEHVARERDALEAKKTAAEAHLRAENELMEKQAGLWQLWRRDGQNRLEIGHEEVSRLESELATERDRHAGRKSAVDAMEKAFRAESKSCADVSARRDDLGKTVSRLDRELVKMQERRRFVGGKKTKAEKRKNEGENAVIEAEHKSRQAGDDIERADREMAELEQQIEHEDRLLNEMRSELKDQTEGLSAELAIKQHDLAPWLDKISEKERALNAARNELELEKEAENRAADGARTATEKVGELEALVATKTTELDEARAELELRQADQVKMQAEIGRLAEEEDRMGAEVATVRQRSQEARAAVERATDGNKIVVGLNKLQERGQISGFHGRLGSLGGIDGRFDVAITTACPGLENLVVDTAEVGQACVEYLRRTGLGRANFILLDKLPARDLGPIATPAGSSRLFDLVRPREPKFAPAFYSVLQNTVVADDLATARKIAYGKDRWRVVTLDGQLIDRSGTMSGGGARVARGGMGETSAESRAEAAERLASLDENRAELEGKLTRISEGRRKREERNRLLLSRIAELELLTGRLEAEINGLNQQLAVAAADADAEGDVSADDSRPARMADLSATIAGLEAEAEALRHESSDAQEAVSALQAKIMAVGGVGLRAQRAKVDGLRDRIKTVTSQSASAKSERVRADRRAEQQRKAVADAGVEFVQTEAELAELDGQLSKLSAEAEAERERADALAIELEDVQSRLARIKAELDEETAEVDAARKAELELTSRIDEKRKTMAESDRIVRALDKKLAGLRLHRLDRPADAAPAPAPAARTAEDNADGGEDMMDIDEEEEDEAGTEAQGGAKDSGDTLAAPVYSPDELDELDAETLSTEIEALTERIGSATIDLSALDEYRRRDAEHAARSADLVAATAERDAAATRVGDLRRLRLEGFMSGFAVISARLKEMYQMITMGGNAELELVDSLDPFAEGILFSVMPPKKSWKNIGNLSGGEKTLSSLALVFALHQYRPTPVYVMDEIDAALDFRNVSIVAAYIKERTRNAQFVVISLRNNMFELAARLVGVYKVNHMTRSVAVDNRDYLKPAATAGGSKPGRPMVKDEAGRESDEKKVAVGNVGVGQT